MKFLAEKSHKYQQLVTCCCNDKFSCYRYVVSLKLPFIRCTFLRLSMWLFQRYYIPTARELARLSGIQRAPILHHFVESLAGAATIRAFDQEGRFSNGNLELVDEHSRPWFHNVSAMEWLSFRLNLLSNFVFACSLVLLVTLPEGIINPSKYWIAKFSVFLAP